VLLSIVIPLYNKAQYVQYTIQSILDQSYQDFEVIVVDDGSTDNGPDLVSALSDPRIRCITQKNGGVSRARNHGVSLAQGDLVCFLDADDWYHPAYLETIAGMAREYPDHRVFATSFQRVPNLTSLTLNARLENINQREIVDNMFSRIIGKDHLFHVCSTAVRRTYLQSLQPCFPEGEQMGEDLDLQFRLAAANAIVACPATLVGYRTDVSMSLCATNRVQTLLPVFHRLEEHAKVPGLPIGLRYAMRALAADARITIARRTLVSGQWKKALRELFAARHGMTRHRWWITLVMCLSPVPDLTLRWQRWRDSSDQTTQI